ncbi:Methyltransferase domain-containing protein [Spirosomataceae bacterium TFI 002]|nr:Methyltransferase domain-containing protein [Spirosomataceae bacterium TFI 002]
MKHYYFLILFSFLISCKSSAQKETLVSQYTFKKGSSDGIGKWYKGREIAHVMGFQGINWLERDNREEEENSTTLLKNMNIKATDHIADIGAGSGYHVFQMAPIASQGMIYAVDIQDEMLAAIKDGKDMSKIDNITLIKGSEQNVNLPENTLDKVLMVDVYHEFNFPREMLLSIKQSLKANGSIYLIEYRAEDPNVPIKGLHKMSEKQAVKEMKAVGMKLERNIENLPWQHCMVFVKED